MECGVGVQDVTGLDVASVRDAVALVSQDSTLFNEDVAYNIAYGRSPAPDELRLSRAFIEKHGLAAFCRVIFNSNEFVHVS